MAGEVPGCDSSGRPGQGHVAVDRLQRLRELDKDANWLVHCEHGRRSLFACEILAKAGFKKLANLRGGMAYWAGCGLPFVRGAGGA